MTRAIVRVRPACGADVPVLADLVRSVQPMAGVLSKSIADAGSGELAGRLRQLVDDPERIILVAVDEDDVVAGMLAARRDQFGAIDPTPVLHVSHLIVAPGQRRRGAGRALLTAAVQAAEQCGIEHVLSTAAAGSREGNRYLARIGFAPLVLHRIAPTSVLRRSLGMSDAAGRVAVLRRARLVRAQRAAFAGNAVGHGA